MKKLLFLLCLSFSFFGRSQYAVEIQNGMTCSVAAQFAIVNTNTNQTTFETYFLPPGNYFINMTLPVETVDYQVEGVRVWEPSMPWQIIPVYASWWTNYNVGFFIANTVPMALGTCGDRNVGIDGDGNNTVIEMQ